jgi:hypothetical protein
MVFNTVRKPSQPDSTLYALLLQMLVVQLLSLELEREGRSHELSIGVALSSISTMQAEERFLLISQSALVLLSFLRASASASDISYFFYFIEWMV